MQRSFLLVAFLWTAALLPRFVAAEPTDDEQTRFFENKIRPVLVQHCYECHGAETDEPGGRLRLNSRESMLVGGESGPAIVPGDPDASLLLRALRYEVLEMPPEKPLSAAVINDMVQWIGSGAAFPDADLARQSDLPSSPAKADDPSDLLWSLKPKNSGGIPNVVDTAWPFGPVDRYVLARQEECGLSPTIDADPRVLVRRLYYDLTGLPPTADRVESFVTSYRHDARLATERLVDELLASPQFGERWGRHWLDVARYGESNGNDGLGRNPTFPHAWRYRDYVIAAWNSDKPYDQFLAEQIAGDLLPYDSDLEHDQHLVATGLLAMAAKPAKAMNNNFQMDVVADQLDVVGRGILGLSIGCARCHDHKFDPIPMRDYYALAGIFTSTETLWGVAGHEKLTAPPTDLHVLKATEHVLPPDGFSEKVLVLESNTGKPKAVPKSKWPPGTPLAMGVRDKAKPADCKLNVKGEASQLGKPIPRGFLSACSLETESPQLLQIKRNHSGRLQLARWLSHPDHPLTSRVIANRVWQNLFGEGLVRTPNDFGVYGARPTHPRLLDYLAERLIQNRWSLKSLIREIVLSRTYQLSGEASKEAWKRDPENRLLARHTCRRLDAEALRDSMLQASGQLALQPAQGSLIRHRDILVNLAGNLHQPSRHRSVYLCYLRSSPPPELAAFNLPDFTRVSGRRDTATVPGQALHLYNSPFVIGQADELAALILNATEDDEQRCRLAFRRVLARSPQGDELQTALDLVRFTMQETDDEAAAWASFCQALLITNEFRYVD